MEETIIRKAHLNDTKEIAKLLKYYAERGVVLGRNEPEISDKIREFTVCEVDGTILGAVSLAIFWEKLAEIRSLVIAPGNQRKGYGKKLVLFSLREAKELGCKTVFTLTYEQDFFRKQGFTLADKHDFSQKIWAECTKCMKFPDCDETAMSINL